MLFFREVLGRRLWSGQRKVVRSVRKNRRTAVRSGHGNGKTFLAAGLLLWFHCCFPGSRVITTATTFAQVRDMLWAEVAKLHRNAKIPIGRGTPGTVRLTEETGWEAFGLSTDDPNAFAGSHYPYQLLIFDEGQGVAADIYDAGEGLMSGANVRWLVIGNPLEPSGRFYELFRDPEWEKIQLSCLDHPNVVSGEDAIPGAVSKRWVDERAKKWGPTHPLWQARVLGDFPAEGSKSVIPLSFLEGAAEVIPPKGDGRHIGFDVAREGTDLCVAVLLVDMRVEAVESWQGMDTMASTGRLLELQKRWQVVDQNIHIDVIGIGSAIVDRMREQGHYVDAVCFGGGAERDWPDIVADSTFVSRRAELFWVARELLRGKLLAIPREYDEAWADLSAPWYKFVSDAKLWVSPKDELRSIIGRSPDFGDAVLLALSRTSSCGIGITRF